jgi:hypothetical protein
MVTNDQKCVNCEKTGLPILPVRYSVLPKDVKAVIPKGISGARVVDIALDAHHYGLRTLREGWVYLFYEVGPRGNRYWEAYKVTSDGRLWKQALPLPRMPVAHPACAQRAIAVPMDLITIERPEKCTGRVFVAFSEHAWHQEVFDRYALDATLRQARMQFIKPSEWIGSGKDANGHAIVATEQAIDDVIEYMPGFDPKLLALPDDKEFFSDEQGSYKDDWLKREVTRYPTCIRQSSPTSASQALVKLMKQVGTKDQGAGDSNPSHPPMLLALWDSIGNVHELNGFRGDPASWLDLYITKERPLQVGALQNIDAAHAVVLSRTDQKLQSQEVMAQQAHSMTPLGQPEAQSALAAQRARALASAGPERAEQVKAYYDDMSWMAANNIPASYQRRLVQLAESTSAASTNSRMPYTGAERDQLMSGARAYAQAQPSLHDRNLAEMRSYNWSKYEARLRRQDLEQFRKHYKTLQSTVFDLQELRSADVGKWLQAKLFLDTLDDYQSTDLADAVAFEIVISDGLAGIGSTPKGKAILDTLVTQWDPAQPESLIWRVVAMNQKDARQELGQLLKIALAKKDMPLESVQGEASTGRSPGVEAVISAAGMMGKLNGYYNKLAKLALEKDPKKITPIGGLLKRLEVDRFGLTVGDAVFAKFRINQLGDFVGEKIVQTVLLQRAGVSYSDALALVRQQAKLEMLSRQEMIDRLLKARSLLRTDKPANAPKATQALYDVWNAMESTDDGIKALRSSRIAVVAALLEAVNFYKLMTVAPDRDTRIKLVQSGASMLSSLITITMTPYYGALKNSVRSQSWKLVGGGLSSFGTFISAWIDREKASDFLNQGEINTFGLYAGKSLFGSAMGVATLIDATSTAAPLLKKLAKRYGTVVVIEAVEIATKRVIALAALRVVGMLTGWEATVLMLGLQAMADWLTPNELESWCSRCAFGTKQETTLRVTDHSVERYMDPSQQEKDFVNAMGKLS